MASRRWTGAVAGFLNDFVFSDDLFEARDRVKRTHVRWNGELSRQGEDILEEIQAEYDRRTGSLQSMLDGGADWLGGLFSGARDRMAERREGRARREREEFEALEIDRYDH